MWSLKSFSDQLHWNAAPVLLELIDDKNGEKNKKVVFLAAAEKLFFPNNMK